MALRHIFISEDPYIFRWQLIKGTYWTIAGLITLLTIVNFVYNDSDGESLGGAFFISVLLGLLLQIIFIPVYLVVKAISINYLVKLDIDAPSKDSENASVKNDDWTLPGLELLENSVNTTDQDTVKERSKLITNSETLTNTINKYGCGVELEKVTSGPSVNLYQYKIRTGEEIKDIKKLEKTISQALDDHTVRVAIDDKPNGRLHVEVIRTKRDVVKLKDIIETKAFLENDYILPIPLGLDTGGVPVIEDLTKMPHLFVAGQTGSGKSVMLNTLLSSLLYTNSPTDLKLILVDPKQVELTPYNDIPHLMTPVITEPDKAISALKWTVIEMERRLKTFAQYQKRNIVEYNNMNGQESMPYIVIVIDELADLMMAAARDVEALIVRIAQKSRAAGIHIVLSTQRPSVDVITGLIKANIPARIAFTVASQVDSRTIIDGIGAEKLIGQGDMLFSNYDMPKAIRVQGAFITDAETIKINDFLRSQKPPQYDDEVVSQLVQLNGKGGAVIDSSINNSYDELWRDAVQLVIDNHKATTSLLQRRLRIGYGRASRLIDEMEEQGIVSVANDSKPRDVLVDSINDVFGSTSASADDSKMP